MNKVLAVLFAFGLLMILAAVIERNSKENVFVQPKHTISVKPAVDCIGIDPAGHLSDMPQPCIAECASGSLAITLSSGYAGCIDSKLISAPKAQ